MKKLQIIAILILSLFFVLSCVSDDEEDFGGDETDTYSGGNSGGDTDTSYDPADSDTSDSSDLSDTTDTTTEPITDPEPTKEEKCTAAGGMWNENSTCTKTSECAAKPANTEWNGESSYTQTYDDGEWSEGAATEYDGEEAGTCRFKCAEGYFWNGTSCVDPCKSNPCDTKEHAKAGSCIAVNATTFTCDCLEEYHWEDNACQSDSRTIECAKPENTKWNTEKAPTVDQKWNKETHQWEPSAESEYDPEKTEGCYFSCVTDYVWATAAEIRKCLPECSTESGTPCKDSASGLIWSARYQYDKEWSEAKQYCSAWEEDEYTKGSWRLPTISELRTLIVKCTYNMPDDDCGVTDNCTQKSLCYDSSICQAHNGKNEVCESDTSGCGSHSKLCETGSLWSSSKDGGNAWVVIFSEGNIGYAETSYTRKVRCVIKDDQNENGTEDSGDGNNEQNP